MAEAPAITQQFRLCNLAEEFTQYSRIEAERLQITDPDFDESLYKQAVELVLRKLKQRQGASS